MTGIDINGEGALTAEAEATFQAVAFNVYVPVNPVTNICVD
jgi:hypothetical protein